MLYYYNSSHSRLAEYTTYIRHIFYTYCTFMSLSSYILKTTKLRLLILPIHNVQCTTYSVRRAVYDLQCTTYTVRIAVYVSQYTPRSVR